MLRGSTTSDVLRLKAATANEFTIAAILRTTTTTGQ
jgi:hypothetical protein